MGLHGQYMSRANISFALLPVSLFLNGPVFHKKVFNRPWHQQEGMFSAKQHGFPNEHWIAAHASWVASHTMKAALLRRVGAWNLEHGTYPNETAASTLPKRCAGPRKAVKNACR